MFGAHLDPVFTLGNMSKLANVVGAKRIGTVLSKADASALNGIMGQTHQMFNKMGMSDYVGEVSEDTMDNCGAPCSILMMPINRIRTVHVPICLPVANFMVTFGEAWHSLWD